MSSWYESCFFGGLGVRVRYILLNRERVLCSCLYFGRFDRKILPPGRGGLGARLGGVSIACLPTVCTRVCSSKRAQATNWTSFSVPLMLIVFPFHIYAQLVLDGLAPYGGAWASVTGDDSDDLSAAGDTSEGDGSEEESDDDWVSGEEYYSDAEARPESEPEMDDRGEENEANLLHTGSSGVQVGGHGAVGGGQPGAEEVSMGVGAPTAATDEGSHPATGMDLSAVAGESSVGGGFADTRLTQLSPDQFEPFAVLEKVWCAPLSRLGLVWMYRL